VSRALRTLLAASGIVLAAASGAGAAQTKPDLNVRIEEDTRPRAPMAGGLSVAYTVTVTDKASGQPVDRYVVFAQATNQAGEKSISFACGHTNDVDPRTPPGVYYCTVILDHGGNWDLVATVADKGGNAEAPVPVAQASVPFQLATNQVVSGEVPGTGLSASPWDIGVLFAHSSVAVAWFLSVALLVALGVPGVRRFVSTTGLHRLERRLDVIVKAAWVTTGLVLSSGTYLTLNQTAYATPFSSSAAEAVFRLPYGKPYFLALGTKIALYLLMVAATLPLVRGARRQLLVSDTAVPAAPPVAPLSAIHTGGGVACDVRTEAPPALERRIGTSRALRVAVAVVAGGGVGVAVCITVLKYLHELIESARGLL
jgi:hypothetical protein